MDGAGRSRGSSRKGWRIVARVHTLKTRKDRICEKCRGPINPGDQYRYFQVGFRNSFKHIRCMKPGCTPRPSELTNSKVSSIMAAQEGAGDELDALTASVGEPSDITAIVERVAEAIEEVKGEYEEGLEAWPGGNSNIQERVDTLESAYDELSSFQFSGDESKPGCDEHEGEPQDDCDACEASAGIWWSDLVQEARDAIDQVELP